MLSLLLFAAQALAAPAPRAIETLAMAEIDNGKLHIKFRGAGCGREQAPVTYLMKLRESHVHESPPDFSGAHSAIRRTVEVDYDVTAVMADATLADEVVGTKCEASAFENSVDLADLARKNGDMDFSQPDTAFSLRFHLTNKVSGDQSVSLWPKKSAAR